jgi:hypothetical protein
MARGTESSWLPGNSGSPTVLHRLWSEKQYGSGEMVQTGSMPEGEYFIPAGKVAGTGDPSADESEKLPIMAINFGVAIKVVTASCSIYPSATNVD